MRNSVKKAAVTALVCVTAAGMMAGCGNKKLDGTKIAVTVNKQEIPFGVVSLAARMQQAQAEAMYKMYLGGGSDMSIWSTKMGDDSDETYGENAVTTSVETVEKMCGSRSTKKRRWIQQVFLRFWRSTGEDCSLRRIRSRNLS